MVASRETSARDGGRRGRGRAAPQPAAAVLVDRDRPANVDAERAVLGSILLKPDVCDDIALLIRPEDFSDESHQILYQHLLELHDSGKRIDAICRDNRLTVTTTTNLAAASVLLDQRLVDFEKPVELELNGQTRAVTLQPSLRTLCDTLQRRGDPELAFTVEIALPLDLAAPAKPVNP